MGRQSSTTNVIRLHVINMTQKTHCLLTNQYCSMHTIGNPASR